MSRKLFKVATTCQFQIILLWVERLAVAPMLSYRLSCVKHRLPTLRNTMAPFLTLRLRNLNSNSNINNLKMTTFKTTPHQPPVLMAVKK